MTALGVDPVITETGTVLRLSGELDLGTVAEAEDALFRIENEGPGGITLDLRYLGFIDSTGLRFILSAHARAVEQDRPFAIVRGPGPRPPRVRPDQARRASAVLGRRRLAAGSG